MMKCSSDDPPDYPTLYTDTAIARLESEVRGPSLVLLPTRPSLRRKLVEAARNARRLRRKAGETDPPEAA